VASCTVRTGVLRRDFHAHELQFHDRVVGHVCDMCGLRLVAGAKVGRCSLNLSNPVLKAPTASAM